MDWKSKKHFISLIEELHQGVISKERLNELDRLLKDDLRARQIYLEYTFTHTSLIQSLRPAENIYTDPPKSHDANFFNDVLQELSSEEKNAPAVYIPQEKAEPVQVVRHEKNTYRLNRQSVITILCSAAAVLFVVLFAKYAPVKTSQEVAALTDSINARWADRDVIEEGARLIDSGAPLALLEGCVELLFDNQTRVVVEGPTEFQVIAADQLKLNFGRVYAVVSEKAYGFTISTDNSKIIDLGTEFGVQKNSHGENTEVHVLKGKVNLISRVHGSKINMDIPEGKANLIEGATGEIKNIKCNNALFVRDINSGMKTIWRGESIDLASIIAGGNGLLPAPDFKTLNPNTGRYETKPLVSIESLTNSSYNPVLESPFIDGVFVPAKNNESMVITSGGHVISCPPTSGRITYNIASFFKKYEAPVSQKPQPAIFDGIAYQSQASPSVLLHSNVGITIDLEQIRNTYSGIRMERLQTGYGLTWAEARGQTDFLVFLDGVLVHEHKDIKSREAVSSVDLKLNEDARFLTFIVTDSPTKSQAIEVAHEYDFFYLLKPQLILQ